MKRFRIKYAKLEGLRYTGNLDIHKVWERIFRREGLELAYSQGFHPQPRLQQAFPVPLGFSSKCNYVDVWLENDLESDEVLRCLSGALHPSIHIKTVEVVELKSPAMQTMVTAADYTIFLKSEFSTTNLEEKINLLMQFSSVIRQRRGKTYDLRPLIHHIIINQDSSEENISISIRLSALPGATGRPEEVLQELGIPISEVKMEHSGLVFSATQGVE